MIDVATRRAGSERTGSADRRSTEMIYIDLPADLNLEDDSGGNIADLGIVLAGEPGHVAVVPVQSPVWRPPGGCR
jgi:hypothetical protein